MSIKQTFQAITLGLFMAVGVAGVTAVALPAVTVSAACKDGEPCCGGVQTSIISCDQTGEGSSVQDSGLWGILLLVVNILTAGVGVLALAGIVYGSILYTSAGGSSEQIKKAKDIFMNVAIGVIAFALMFSVLNFLVPGGIFN